MAENTGIEWATHTFNPWRETESTRVVDAESQWRLPLKWDRKAKKSGVRARVFCASLADVFEDWQGPMLSATEQVWTKPYLEREWGYENWTTCDQETMRQDSQGWLYVTMHDVRLRLFKLIDPTPNLDWLLLTKRPENVMKFTWTHPVFHDRGIIISRLLYTWDNYRQIV